MFRAQFLENIRVGYMPFLLCHYTHGWFGEVDGFEFRIHWIRSGMILGQASAPWTEADDDEIPF